jgi:hypothetical protein
MTKSEQREATQAVTYGATLGLDYLARALSALIRAARTAKSRDAIYAIAYAHRAHLSAEFII